MSIKRVMKIKLSADLPDCCIQWNLEKANLPLNRQFVCGNSAIRKGYSGRVYEIAACMNYLWRETLNRTFRSETYYLA